MRCPVCSENYGLFRGPSFLRSKECTKCGTPIIAPPPTLGLLITALMYVILIPILINLLNYLPVTSWMIISIVLFTLICYSPQLIHIGKGKYFAVKKSYGQKITAWLILCLQIFICVLGASIILPYALSTYHAKDSNLIASADSFRSVTFSDTGNLVAFIQSEEDNNQAYNYLMLYNLITKELREIAPITEKGVQGILIAEDEQSIHYDFIPEDEGLTRRITFDLLTGEKTVGLRTGYEAYINSSISRPSFDSKYEWKRINISELHVWDDEKDQLVKSIVAYHPRNFIWAPNNHQAVYQVSHISIFGETEAQLCFVEF